MELRDLSAHDRAKSRLTDIRAGHGPLRSTPCATPTRMHRSYCPPLHSRRHHNTRHGSTCRPKSGMQASTSERRGAPRAPATAKTGSWARSALIRTVWRVPQESVAPRTLSGIRSMDERQALKRPSPSLGHVWGTALGRLERGPIKGVGVRGERRKLGQKRLRTPTSDTFCCFHSAVAGHECVT